LHTGTGSGSHWLRGANRMAVVRQLCVHPGMSRSEIADALGLTRSTVTVLVRELIAEGWAVEHDVAITGDVGRRPTPLFIDSQRLLLVGAEVGLGSLRLVATSLTGRVRARSSERFDLSRGPRDAIAVLASAMLSLLGQMDHARHCVVGIGVAFPGGVDEAQGFLHFAPNLGWRDVSVAVLLRRRLAGTALAGVPVFMQNEANAGALAEAEFGAPSDDGSLLYLSVNEGVGAGLVVNGRLLTGARGFAGEVGHMVLQPGGRACSCGRRGCAEALVGARALLPEDAPARAGLAEVQRGLAEGDAGTLERVEAAGHALGLLMQNLAAAYDPSCMVLGGKVVALGEALLATAFKVFAEYGAAGQLQAPHVRMSGFGEEAIAVGAAGLVRYRLTRPLHIPPPGPAPVAAQPRSGEMVGAL